MTPLSRGAAPPERERIGVLIRDLEVIVTNYHSDGWRTRNESDAELFAEWQRVRGSLFDALSDLTGELAGLRERLAAAEREGRLLAMLASDTPQFFNPLTAFEAQAIRDRILSAPVRRVADHPNEE